MYLTVNKEIYAFNSFNVLNRFLYTVWQTNLDQQVNVPNFPFFVSNKNGHLNVFPKKVY